MKIISKQESIMASVKRDADATNLLMWHRRLGHLGDTMLKKLVNSKTVKGMDVTDTHLDGICEECILSKIGPMNPEARWSHAKFSLVINDDCSGFGFMFNLKHKDEAAKSIMDLDKAIEAKFHKRTHTLKTDNGGKFINSTLQNIVKSGELH